MSRKPLMMRIAALALASGASQLQAAELKLPDDGWASWEVPAPEGTPFWCCWSNWNRRGDPREPCKLDEHPQGYGTRDDDATTDTVRVYAHATAGKLDRLQVLAAACPVNTRTQVQELTVAADDSARWLIDRARQDGSDSVTREPLVQQALAALAMHRGDLPGQALADFARRDPRQNARKWSVFWLALLRGGEGADITSSVMFNDPEPEVRKHAAFAISQSKSPRAATDLIRQGSTDKDGDVRAQAWFWLAQTGYADAEAAIAVALRKDADDHVREHAVFALSQLPAERSIKALIDAAEDRSLSREQRKRAVFWLSQSESDAAQKYLEKVLARTVPR
jgi:HEAT repeat protein